MPRINVWVVSAALASVVWNGAVLAEERPDLVIAIEGVPNGLAPGQNTGNLSQRVQYSIFNGLIERGYWTTDALDGGEPVAGLAESWRRISPTEWEMTLREGVLFHHGEEVTIDDVVFTFSAEHYWGENPIAPAGRSTFNTLTKVEAIDDRTVRFETGAPDAAFLQRFTSVVGYVVPADYMGEGIEAFNLAPSGTGPYRVASFEPGQRLRLEAFDDHFAGAPPAASITFVSVPELASRVVGLLTGEFDIIANVTPDQIPLIERDADVDVRPARLDNHRILFFHGEHPVTGDARIRRAIAHATDRQRIVDELWAGDSTVPVSMSFPGHGALFDPDRQPLTYDPERARALLEEAGYDGAPINLRVTGTQYTNYLEAAQMMLEMWKEVGLEVVLEVRDSRAAALEGSFAMVDLSTGMQFADATNPIIRLYGENGARTQPGRPEYGWTPTPEFLDLAAILESSGDEDERRTAFEQMLDIMDEALPELPLFQAVEYYGVRSTIDWRPYSFWPMDFSARNLAFE